MKVKLFESQAKAKVVLNDNEPRLVRAEGKEICVVRKGEQIFAFQDACAHMGENLHKGKTNYLDEIVCPLHTYRFNMKTGEESEQRCKSLQIYEVITNSDGVYLDV